jgi:phosphatidate cytidylyltransferase
MPAPASNLVLRLATAAFGVPVIVGLVYLGPPWAFYLLVLAASLVGVTELLAMTHPADPWVRAFGATVSAAASLVVFFRPGDARALLTVLVVVPLLGPLVTLARLGAVETAALRACALGFGPLFVVVPLTLLALMRTMFARGSGYVLLALGLAWLADTVAYFFGRFFGKRKLYEAVSPKKTVEGAVGGLVGSVAWSVLGSLWFLRGELPLADAIVLGSVAGALGQAGDLAESLLKRSMGVKDSGAIVPGHGGVLDRVDAVIMTTVAVFLYALWRR